jgi:hypothetical protein
MSYSKPTYETVSQNLKGASYEITNIGGVLDHITYTISLEQIIVKSFHYTGDVLTSITLSGATPAGINLTKTLHYTGSDLTSVSYSEISLNPNMLIFVEII